MTECRSDVVGRVDSLELAEGVYLDDILIIALAYIHLILVTENKERDLIPISLLAAGHLIGGLEVFCELATVRRIPIGDTDLLIAVDTADLLRGDNAVDNVEAPVVGAILLYAEEVRAVVILFDYSGIGDILGSGPVPYFP